MIAEAMMRVGLFSAAVGILLAIPSIAMSIQRDDTRWLLWFCVPMVISMAALLIAFGLVV